MAALTTKTFASHGKSGGARNWGAMSVSVDATSVLELIDSIEEAVSPVALMYWLEGAVSKYFEEQTVDHFASLGGGGVPGGAWVPLQESTLKIRHALGYWDDYAINDRSGELLHFLMNSRDYSPEATGASMTIPGKGGNASVMKKLMVAQKGYTQRSGDMLPGAYTPPRPVLSLTGADTAALHVMLQVHIANWIANGFLQAGTI